MKLNKFAYLKPLGNHTLKIMKKIPGNLLKKTWKNHGNIMEFCQSEKWEPCGYTPRPRGRHPPPAHCMVGQPSPGEQNDRRDKILLCPKLHLWAVKINVLFQHFCRIYTEQSFREIVV